MTIRIHHVPGHGGTDPGTVHGGLVERDWVLAIAEHVRDALERWDCEQSFSRSTNFENPTMSDEAKGARDCDLAIVYHVNASLTATTHGLMTFAKPGDIWGIQAGDAIVRAAPHGLRRDQAKAVLVDEKDQNWSRVWNCLSRYTSPAVLVEFGFATNTADNKLLQDPQYLPSLCTAVLAGVARINELVHEAKR